MTQQSRQAGAHLSHQAEAVPSLRTVRPPGVPPKAVLAVLNPILGAVLRSPLHRMASGAMLLLT